MMRPQRGSLMHWQTREDVFEIRVRVISVELRRADQARERCGTLSCSQRTDSGGEREAAFCSLRGTAKFSLISSFQQSRTRTVFRIKAAGRVRLLASCSNRIGNYRGNRTYTVNAALVLSLAPDGFSTAPVDHRSSDPPRSEVA